MIVNIKLLEQAQNRKDPYLKSNAQILPGLKRKNHIKLDILIYMEIIEVSCENNSRRGGDVLVSFSVENWMSFRDRATFSMVASAERQHSDRIPRIEKYPLRVLPVSAIYGGNASGKTNFFKAMNFVQFMVVKGTSPEMLIPVKPYLLDPSFKDKPTKFTLELLIDEAIYEFYFAVSREKVIEEKLTRVTSTSEKIIYHRVEGKNRFTSDFKKYEKNEFLNFAYKGTRPNQLFLTNTISQNINYFQSINDWFKYRLQLIAPDARFRDYERFVDEGDPLYGKMKKKLSQLDTGISHLGTIEMPFDNIPFPEDFKSELQDKVKEGMTVKLTSLVSTNERYLITRKEGKIRAKRMTSYHKNSEGKEIRFNIALESDGTHRLIDLLPAFTELSEIKHPKVFFIDEIDRSLHTLLTKQLLLFHLSSCFAASRSQLLFTTHDLLLMDQQLFRRDEMWVTERNNDGSTKLFSFSEFKDMRYDNDVRKSYLQGRLGGIPKILLDSSCVAEEG